MKYDGRKDALVFLLLPKAWGLRSRRKHVAELYCENLVLLVLFYIKSQRSLNFFHERLSLD